MQKQQGFTLIELIVVIVILGILAATALPRFIDVQADARLAKATGALGAMKSAANLAHAQQLVAGVNSNVAVTMEGQQVQMANGYPTAAFDGIGVAAGLSTTTAFTGDWVAGTGVSQTFKVATDSGHTTCDVGYSASTGTGPSYSDAPSRSNC